MQRTRHDDENVRTLQVKASRANSRYHQYGVARRVGPVHDEICASRCGHVARCFEDDVVVMS